MRERIDLRQLAERESEEVEWKESVADVDDAVATLCAFANDLQNLGGGYLVYGVREGVDEAGFPIFQRVGLSAARLRELEGRILALCQDRVSPSITPLLDELPADTEAQRVLVFTMAATRSAHSFRRRDGTVIHPVRVGRSTRQARNGLLLTLLTRKGALEPWDERACPTATTSDLDLLALRETLRRMAHAEADGPIDRWLSADEALSPFVPTLCVREGLRGGLQPRHYALLLFGTQPQRHIGAAVAELSVYPGRDRGSRTALRHDFAGTLLTQFHDLWRELRLHAPEVYDKANLGRPNLRLYPHEALMEALVNALVHRDYSLPHPTRVTVFTDRIEIFSPGALPAGVSAAQLRRGRLSPRWRNRSLAWFFRKLGLAQAEGQGLTTIRAAMKAAGCPPPRYAVTEADVTCTLYANPRARTLMAQHRDSGSRASDRA